MKLSSELRNALKAAIAAAPGWAAYREANGKNTGAMSKDELLTAAAALGVQVNGLTVAAPAAKTEDNAEPAAKIEDNAEPAAETEGDAVQEIMSGPIAGLENRVRDALNAAKARDAELRAKLETALAELSKAQVKSNAERAAARGETSGNALTVAAPISSEVVGTKTVAEVFGISPRSALGKKQIRVWNCPISPAIDPDFIWSNELLADILATQAAPRWRDRHIWLFGQRGTGKTSVAEQFAARTGRPYVRCNFDMSTDAPELFGAPGLRAGNTFFQDGALTAACRIPGCVILLDEPTIARPGALMALNPVLDNGSFTIKETGELVTIAPGVLFFAADNTNGLEDVTGQYAGTAPVNSAFLDRFAAHLEISWLDAGAEAKALAARSGCNLKLAERLVAVASVTRRSQESGELLTAVGPRRLIALAHALHFGTEPRRAWRNCVVNSAASQDGEQLAQIANAHFNAAEISALARGEDYVAPSVSSPQGANAAQDFANAPAIK